jgi:hypothetical protein
MFVCNPTKNKFKQGRFIAYILLGISLASDCVLSGPSSKALKMDLTEGSETSAKHNLMAGKYPKEHIQYSEHSESLKSRVDLA